MPIQVVLDTNVLDAGLRSRRGASVQILRLIGRGSFEINLSVPLALEYEAVLLRHRVALGITDAQVIGFVDYLCSVANLHEIHYLWRPMLRDPSDEMVAELAVKAGCRYVSTHNTRDFTALDEQFGITILTPGAFLRTLRTTTPPVNP
jgi:predicted nucleic acid-binding protein